MGRKGAKWAVEIRTADLLGVKNALDRRRRKAETASVAYRVLLAPTDLRIGS